MNIHKRLKEQLKLVAGIVMCRDGMPADIALLFGVGNAFDSVVSLAVYIFIPKKRRSIF